MPGARRLKVASLTNSAETGDFKRAVAMNTNIPIGDYPVVLVIKKHRSILNYLRKWIVEVEGQPTGQGNRKIVHDVPVLVIDDEADNASVNVARWTRTRPVVGQRRHPRTAGELRQGRLRRVHGHAFRQHLHRSVHRA